MPEAKSIQRIIKPREKDLGGFSVRRILPTTQQKMIGPWVFFDHMGPAKFRAGEGIDVRPHPHINLATVTYLFAGEIYHRDSLGSSEPILPGDINLMVAGRGIVHSERERPEVKHSPHQLDGLQLWLALPTESEEIDPAFYHYDSDEIPASNQAGVSVRVLMGSAYGLTSPVKTFAKTLYVEARLAKGEKLELPIESERGLYVAKGGIQIQGDHVSSYEMAVLNQDQVTLEATSDDTRIALIGGENIGHRYIDWNFVSSNQDRIAKAKADWKAQRFPKVPGDEEEFIPLPD